jgi:hypothetical protein
MADAPDLSNEGGHNVLFLFFRSQAVRQTAGRDFFAGAAHTPRRSGDDVGRDLVFDEGDAVAQLQLALLQSLQPQQIRGGRLMQRIDRRVEIAVLLRKAVDTLWAISLRRVPSATAKNGCNALPTLVKLVRAGRSSSAVPAHFSLHMAVKK